jgi:hypothetical protein
MRSYSAEAPVEDGVTGFDDPSRKAMADVAIKF